VVVTDLPHLRVHDKLGVLLKLPGQDSWLWVMPDGQVQAGRVTDDFAERPGWRELSVFDPPAHADRSSGQVAYMNDGDLEELDEF
jgi:hypothetical protein